MANQAQPVHKGTPAGGSPQLTRGGPVIYPSFYLLSRKRVTQLVGRLGVRIFRGKAPIASESACAPPRHVECWYCESHQNASHQATDAHPGVRLVRPQIDGHSRRRGGERGGPSGASADDPKRSTLYAAKPSASSSRNGMRPDPCSDSGQPVVEWLSGHVAQTAVISSQTFGVRPCRRSAVQGDQPACARNTAWPD